MAHTALRAAATVARGGTRALRQRPHLRHADPDDVRPGRPGVVGRGAAAAVRAGVSAAIVVPFRAAARRQLRPASAHRHWPGDLLSPAAVEPAGAPRAGAQPPAESARAA